MARAIPFKPDPNAQVMDLVHVIYPEDYFCPPDRILGLAHDALVNNALDDYVKQNGPLPDDADGDVIFQQLQQSNPRPTNLEDAKALLEDLGLMTFGRV